jgi:hypothetical protein
MSSTFAFGSWTLAWLQHAQRDRATVTTAAAAALRAESAATEDEAELAEGLGAASAAGAELTATEDEAKLKLAPACSCAAVTVAAPVTAEDITATRLLFERARAEAAVQRLKWSQSAEGRFLAALLQQGEEEEARRRAKRKRARPKTPKRPKRPKRKALGEEPSAAVAAPAAAPVKRQCAARREAAGAPWLDRTWR